MNNPRMGFVLCLCLAGEKRQSDAKRRPRSKRVHFIATESDPPLEFLDNGNGSVKINAGLRP
jgi:hypothetical protein